MGLRAALMVGGLLGVIGQNGLKMEAVTLKQGWHGILETGHAVVQIHYQAEAAKAAVVKV